MNRLFKTAIILIVLGATLYLFRGVILEQVPGAFENIISQIRTKYLPCSEPITYTLETFDNQFGISKEYFLEALQDAEAIWEKPFGKALFAYAPTNGQLKINLIYDYRQQATGKLEGLGITVKDTQVSYDALKIQYEGSQAEYVKAKSEFEARVAAFNEKNKSYQEQVLYWNKRGGAARREYGELEVARLALNTESAKLQTTQKQLNEMIDKINAFVVVLNRLAISLSLTAKEYNMIGASRGESFEEGLYKSSGGSAEIDVYEFSSHEKLVRVLAHEFGHALGLEHVDDPKAIMYQFNKGNNETLTQADASELKAKCKIQ